MQSEKPTSEQEKQNRKNVPFGKRALARPLRYAAVAVSAMITLTVPTTSWGFGIVFDPAIYAKNIQQVQQDIQMLQIMQQQLQQEEMMLASLNINLFPQLDASMNQLQAIIEQPTYLAANVQAVISTDYPLNFANVSNTQMLALQQQWQQSQRSALVENRQIQNQIVAQMPATSSQVGQLVAASNSAPGATSALQAGNQIVATLAGQLQELEALEASNQRTDTQKQAIYQSQRAYADQQRAAVMRDWNTPATTQRIPMPFGQQ
ncbi:MAG: TrbJ/VirB5 family protein [Phycisphaerae bacterium]